QLYAQRHERSVEDGVPDTAVAEHGQVVNRLRAVRADEPEVDGRRGLQLDFEQLLLDIRELSVVLPDQTPERFAYGLVQRTIPVAFLRDAGIDDRSAD